MYLEGELERGIVPDESVWMQGGGAGEDGCLLLLRKMNLELLRQCGPALQCTSSVPCNVALHQVLPSCPSRCRALCPPAVHGAGAWGAA